VIDTTPAAVTTVSSTAANGAYGAGAVIPVTISFSKAVTVTGTPRLALNSGGVASYSSGSGTTTIKNQRIWMVLGALLASLGGPTAARADVLLTAQPVYAHPGDVNDVFNLYLTNVGATPVDVAGFSFEINTTSPDITFEQATTPTTLYPYIFAGNSLFGPVISTSVPGQTLDASDVAAAPNSFTTVNPGASFGLGLVSFDVAPGAPMQVAPVTFNPNSAFTNVSEQLGNLLPLEFASGKIIVPEPATGLLLLVLMAGMIAVKWGRRFRLPTLRPGEGHSVPRPP